MSYMYFRIIIIAIAALSLSANTVSSRSIAMAPGQILIENLCKKKLTVMLRVNAGGDEWSNEGWMTVQGDFLGYLRVSRVEGHYVLHDSSKSLYGYLYDPSTRKAMIGDHPVKIGNRTYQFTKLDFVRQEESGDIFVTLTCPRDESRGWPF